jgi:hypothetical protein
MLGRGFRWYWRQNRAVSAAIATIAEDSWTPVRYPGAVTDPDPDPDAGELISDAEVAEVAFTTLMINSPTTHPKETTHSTDLKPRLRIQAKLPSVEGKVLVTPSYPSILRSRWITRCGAFATANGVRDQLGRRFR